MTTVNAAEDLSSMFTEGKVSGQVRMFHIDRDYMGTVETHRNGTALGGHLKFETADFKGLSVAAAFYTTNRIFEGEEIDTYDPTLFGLNGKNYALLGELYAQYGIGNTTLKFGRQKLDTPLAGSDDARMVPNLFEAYLAINKDIPDTTLIAGHVTKFAQGTFGNAYNAAASTANAVLSATAGYSAVDSRTNVGKFMNAGEYAVGENTEGISVLSATYTGIDKLKLQVWDYYAWDILNALYAQADFSWNCLLSDNVHPYASAQLIKEDDVGDAIVGNVDAMYWAAKLGAKFANANLYVAYSENDSDAGSLANGALITPWGGMPAFTQGMVTRHQFFAGAEALKVAASYDWKDFGLNLSTGVYYTEFKLGNEVVYGTKRTTKEPGFDIIYYPEFVKNLQLRLRGNFPDEYADNLDWDEYRFIVNYNF